MAGVSLNDLDSSDLLDVLHFLFEDDVSSSSTAEQLEARDKTRKMVYSEFYGREYRHGFSTYSSGVDKSIVGAPENSYLEEDEAPPVPLDPLARSGKAVKPYVPPTRVDENSRLPFGAALDGPLG